MAIEYEQVPIPSDLNVEELVKLYVETRDELDAKRREWKNAEARANDLLDRLSMVLKDFAEKIGVESFKTKYGTAYKSTKKTYRAVDWDESLKFILETGNYQLLYRRISTKAAEEIHQSTGSIPPGIDLVVEVSYNVRQS